MKTKGKGFTLIELMIAVAIIGILAAIVVPAYQDSVRKARRSDGMTSLLNFQRDMEKFRGNCPHYPGTRHDTATSCNTANSASSTIAFPSASTDGNYTITITSAASSSAYTLQATATGVQAGDTSCSPLTLTVNSANPKGLKGPAGCWN